MGDRDVSQGRTARSHYPTQTSVFVPISTARNSPTIKEVG